MSKLQNRSVVEVVILSIVTFGIYQFYWMYKVNEELRQEKQDVAPFKYFVWPIAAVIALLIAGLIFLGVGAAIGDSAVAGKIFAGIGAVILIIDYSLFIAMFFGLYGYFIFWLYKFSKALEVVSKKKIDFIVTFLVGLLVGGVVWIAVTQHMINENVAAKAKS